MSLTNEELKLIGGSDAAAIAGIHPYKSPIAVWRRIVLCEEPERSPEELETLERGNLLEPVIREMYRRRTGEPLLGPTSFRKDFMRASLDDRTADKVVEFKSANIHQRRRWSETEQPIEYLCQVQWYLHLSGLQAADLAVLLDLDLEVYQVAPDLELQSLLVEAASKFWRDYVETKTPPPPDGTLDYASFLATRYPKGDGTIVKADSDAETWAKAYREACSVRDEAEAKAENAKAWLKAAIGPADGLEGDGWRISFKQSKGQESIDWKAVAKAANIPKALIEQYTSRKPFRTFRPRWSKEE